jgi:mRNA-degrading endonuclease RelE of RelBE toxin-antitoxin system
VRFDYQFTRPAERRFSRLSAGDQRRVLARLERLCDDPFATGVSKALHGPLTGVRSSRVGALRILYEIRGATLFAVLDVGPRGDIYKRS